MAIVDGFVLKQRTKNFALRVIKFVRSLPRDKVIDELSRQLLHASCSVAANYRAVCRAKSRADFIAKMGIVEEEADECLFWMEIITEAGLVKPTLLTLLMAEANEITSIVVASIRTARRHGKGRTLPVPPIPQSEIRSPQ